MKKKSKKEKQISSKLAHKEALKTRRRAEPLLERAEAKILQKPTILIVCEGENTEPSYFRQFKLSSATIKPVGIGYNTVSLVKKAYQLSREKSYEQIWCVFDADPKPDNPRQAVNFNDAVSLAIRKGFSVAYSNQAFEYWIILHFEDHQGCSMSRRDYNYKINKLLEPFELTYNGDGDKIITEKIFEVLDGIDDKTNMERKRLAILRAERNYNHFDHSNLAKEDSSTTVFRLVKELIRYV